MSVSRHRRKHGRSFTYRTPRKNIGKRLAVVFGVLAALALVFVIWWMRGGREVVFSLRSDPLRNVVTDGLVPVTDAPTDVPTPTPTIEPTDTPSPTENAPGENDPTDAPVVPTLVPDGMVGQEDAGATAAPDEANAPDGSGDSAEMNVPAAPVGTQAPVPVNPMSRSGAEGVEPNSATSLPEAAQAPEILLPLTGVKIGLDPGHQEKANSAKEPVSPGSSETKAKVSSGTQGIVTRVPEYVVVLDVSFQLREALEALGAEVYMTRESHQVDISNIERAQMMNELGVDLVLRIHCNGSSDSSVHGISLFVKSKGSGAEESYAACEALLPAMAEATGARAMGIYKSDTYSGLNWSEVPSILVEMGFMSNEAEDRLLNDPEYQQKLVDGMVQGVADYMGRDLTALPAATEEPLDADAGEDVPAIGE